MSDDTEQFKKSLISRIIGQVMDKLAHAVTAGITIAIVTIYQQHHVHNQIWKEVGPHLQDNVAQIQDLQVESDGFTHTNSLYNTNK